MRILAARFRDASDFLKTYDADRAGGAVFYRTRIPLAPGESVILDIRLPALPNAVLARARIGRVDPERGGVWIAFGETDRVTHDFLLGVARGQRGIRAYARRRQRLPIELQIDWRVDGSRDLFISSTEDVSWGGMFVRTLSPPPVGSDISVVVPLPRGTPLCLPGRVARTSNGDQVGMAVLFRGETADRRQLRRLLRRMHLRGVASFPN